ncbi:MAG: hypothetical protein U9R08_04750, partial [Nanoarchaeota archaeon]|nr:hypothetical protein [Nanoarchaeota archaeon]
MTKRGNQLFVSILLVFLLTIFSFAVLAAEDVVVTKTSLTPSVENQTVAEFFINVTNIGDVNVTGYSVWDEYDDTYFDFLDDGADVSPNYTDYNMTTNEIGWFFDLNTSQSFLIYINFTTKAVGNTTNNVTLENSTEAEIDFDFANQEINASVVNVTITKTATSDTVENGSVAEFSVSVTNNDAVQNLIDYFIYDT